MKNTSTIHRLMKYLCIAAAITILSCDEPMPPYQEPKNVLVADLSVSSKDTLLVFEDGTSGGLFFSDQIILNAAVTNTHDDLLQGKALVSGKIVLQSFAEISRTMVVVLSPAELRSPPEFQGNIALGPGKKALFSTIWVPLATDKKFVFEGLPSTAIGTAKLYGPINFVAYSDIQIFDRVQSLRSPTIQFTLYFKVELRN